MSQIFELSEILDPRTPEIIGLKIMEYEDFALRSISLLSEKAERIITAKVHVFSDSILCQGEASDQSTANAAWKKEVEWYGKNNFRKDLNGIDGRHTEFVWKISQDPRCWRSWRKFKNSRKAYSLNLKNSKDESFLCRCSRRSSGKKMAHNVFTILLELVTVLASSLAVIVHSWHHYSKRRGAEPVLKNQNENGTKLQHQ